MLISPYGRLSKWLHWLFEASLVIKGLLAASETLSGLGLLLAPHGAVLTSVAFLTFHPVTADPSDPMGQWFRDLAAQFSIADQHFYALYFLGHGALKFAMVLMLARRVLWGYPIAMAILAGFVVYQASEYLRHDALALLGLALLDAFMIALVYREWNMLRLLRGQITAKP